MTTDGIPPAGEWKKPRAWNWGEPSKQIDLGVISWTWDEQGVVSQDFSPPEYFDTVANGSFESTGYTGKGMYVKEDGTSFETSPSTVATT